MRPQRLAAGFRIVIRQFGSLDGLLACGRRSRVVWCVCEGRLSGVGGACAVDLGREGGANECAEVGLGSRGEVGEDVVWYGGFFRYCWISIGGVWPLPWASTRM